MSSDPLMTIDEMHTFLRTSFPQLGSRFTVESIVPNQVRVCLDAGHEDLRPGGTVSGPALFTLADTSAYVVILAMIGPVALTVTTGCSINFMRKPDQGKLTAEAKILKLGKSLCVVDVLIYSGGRAEPVVQATLTYSIPPKRN